MDTFRQILEWQVGEDRFVLIREPDRWTLKTPRVDLELSTAAFAALADAVARLDSRTPSGRPPHRERAGKPWTEDEEAELEQQFAEGVARREMARLHGRSLGAIGARLVRLGLESPAVLPPLPSGRRFPTAGPERPVQSGDPGPEPAG